MHKKVQYLVVIALMILCVNPLLAIDKITDKKITAVMENLVFVSDTKYKNFNLRIFFIREDGECDGTPESCPKKQMYLVISSLEEYPDRAVYLLPYSHDWKIVDVMEADCYDEYQKHLVVLFDRTIISKDTSTGWWSNSRYVVEISPWKFRHKM